jgi:peptide/nickel transport system substrate-binding protein
VGAGPFKVRGYEQGIRVSLQAHDRYVLGRPRIDEIEVRIIPDQNTLVANILAGEVTTTIGKTISAEQALEIVRRMPNERIDNKPANFISQNPQFINPTQPLILNLEFRKALMYAMNRQALVDSLLGGQGPGVAHTWTIPKFPEYQNLDSKVPRYDYDPRKAAQMIEALGYTKAADGFFHDSKDQPLFVHLRTYQVDADVKSQLAVADDWQRLGIKNDQDVMSPQVASDNQYVYTFPDFLIQRSWGSLFEFTPFYSYNVPQPSNNFKGGYSGRYMSKDLDSMIDTFYATIPLSERARAAEQILVHLADQVVLMPLFYDIDPHILDTRLVNISGSAVSNAHEWDFR